MLNCYNWLGFRAYIWITSCLLTRVVNKYVVDPGAVTNIRYKEAIVLMENRDGFVFIDCVSIVSNRINTNTTYHSHNSANWSVDSLFASPQSVHIQIKRQSPLEGMYCLDLIIEL